MNIFYVNNKTKGSDKMKFSYIKLNAQKKLLKNHFICFCVSFLPYVTIVLLSLLNYYLYIFLKGINFNFIPSISSYDVYVKASLFTLSVCVSFVLWKISQIYSQKYFYSQINKKHTKLKIRQYVTAIIVSILKFFLSVAWSSFYLLPCAVTIATLYYSIQSRDYTFNVMLTLFIASAILFIIGISFIYVTLKRYSMCNFVIFTDSDTDAIKVIEKSINLAEGNTVKYAFFCLSFIGWILSCVLVVPMFYVLPYMKISKYSFYKVTTRPQESEFETQKPIIFYINKKEKA